MVGTHREFDTVLELCGDQHRRIVLGVLAEQRRPVPVHDLTEAIVERDHDRPLEAVPEETAKRVRIALHHTHLPKLEGGGLVEYDAEWQLVEPTAQFDGVAPHLSAILDADPVLSPSLEV